MKYEEFICLVQRQVTDTLGDTVNVEMHHVRKNNNVELDGLAIREEGSAVAPTIYLNGFYEEYKRGKSIQDIVEAICMIYEKSKVTEQIDVSEYTDYEHVKKSLACKLINRERNRELIKNIPFLPFLNLVIVAYYKVDHPLLGSGSILVTNKHLDTWNISAEELFYEARKNTREVLPERFENIGTVLENDPNYEAPDEYIPMFVLRNDSCYYGAVNMIYDNVLSEIGEILHDDFWIIPSSIHECIILPVSADITADEIASMIFQVNSEKVSEEEYLSDNLYCYRRNLHKLTIVETIIA